MVDVHEWDEAMLEIETRKVVALEDIAKSTKNMYYIVFIGMLIAFFALMNWLGNVNSLWKNWVS